MRLPLLALVVPRDSAFAMPPYVVALLGKYLCYAILAVGVDMPLALTEAGQLDQFITDIYAGPWARSATPAAR